MVSEGAERSVWAVCMPWRLRDLDEFNGHPRGAECEVCRRDIAVDRACRDRLICCYCAANRGWLVDRPLGSPPLRVIVDVIPQPAAI